MITAILLCSLVVLCAYVGSQRRFSPVQMGLITAFFCLGAVFVVQPELANRTARWFNES